MERRSFPEDQGSYIKYSLLANPWLPGIPKPPGRKEPRLGVYPSPNCRPAFLSSIRLPLLSSPPFPLHPSPGRPARHHAATHRGGSRPDPRHGGWRHGRDARPRARLARRDQSSSRSAAPNRCRHGRAAGRVRHGATWPALLFLARHSMTAQMPPRMPTTRTEAPVLPCPHARDPCRVSASAGPTHQRAPAPSTSLLREAGRRPPPTTTPRCTTSHAVTHRLRPLPTLDASS